MEYVRPFDKDGNLSTRAFEMICAGDLPWFLAMFTPVAAERGLKIENTSSRYSRSIAISRL